jgi:hypothetical protein
MAILSSKMGNLYNTADFTCGECGNPTIPLPRRKHGKHSRRSKDGHIKHLWCHHCKKTTAQIEKIRRY